MSKTILVTGGAGFVGSHLCERLVKDGYQVICFDNLSAGRLDNIKNFQSQLTFIQGDANNLADLEPIFRDNKLDAVFHYAAMVGVRRTAENPIEVLNDVKGVRNVFELALKYGQPKIVYASSSEVYGEPVEIPEKEDGHINPKIPYAVVKLYGEKMVEAYWQKYQLPSVALRFFNVYGPRQESSDYGFVMGIFIKRALAGEPPIIFGDGSQTRDFVYVDDNIEACILAWQSEKANGQTINIGTGKPTTILDLAEAVIEATGKTGQLAIEFQSSRDDIKHRFPDVDKMQSLLNFHPKVSLKEGLQKTIKQFFV
ncbi:MAG: SDR family NAD(P)-dependent oxidoreductase [Candidatus Gribaldobacteria bacterium]|nr:SDR family NAD(P)-dependent oxidoreductase [Candidatus Gribaldobacteria bacterium]